MTSNTDAADWFGVSVALNGDGNIMAIGAMRESSRSAGLGGDQTDNGAAESGAVYVFRRTGASWAQVSYVHAHFPDPGDHFGSSVDLSADGATMAVGAMREDGGGEFFNPVADDERDPDSGAGYIF